MSLVSWGAMALTLLLLGVSILGFKAGSVDVGIAAIAGTVTFLIFGLEYRSSSSLAGLSSRAFQRGVISPERGALLWLVVAAIMLILVLLTLALDSSGSAQLSLSIALILLFCQSLQRALDVLR